MCIKIENKHTSSLFTDYCERHHAELFHIRGIFGELSVSRRKESQIIRTVNASAFTLLSFFDVLHHNVDLAPNAITRLGKVNGKIRFFKSKYQNRLFAEELHTWIIIFEHV